MHPRLSSFPGSNLLSVASTASVCSRSRPSSTSSRFAVVGQDSILTCRRKERKSSGTTGEQALTRCKITLAWKREAGGVGMGGTNLQGKVAVVTGGARGIGRAYALALAGAGAAVMIADLLDEEGRNTAKSIQAKGAKPYTVTWTSLT